MTTHDSSDRELREYFFKEIGAHLIEGRWDISVDVMIEDWIDRLLADRETAVLSARLDERMSTLATTDGKLHYLDGANNRSLTDRERISELQEALKQKGVR